jgi:hypothetical protein
MQCPKNCLNLNEFDSAPTDHLDSISFFRSELNVANQCCDYFVIHICLFRMNELIEALQKVPPSQLTASQLKDIVKSTYDKVSSKFIASSKTKEYETSSASTLRPEVRELMNKSQDRKTVDRSTLSIKNKENVLENDSIDTLGKSMTWLDKRNMKLGKYFPSSVTKNVSEQTPLQETKSSGSNRVTDAWFLKISEPKSKRVHARVDLSRPFFEKVEANVPSTLHPTRVGRKSMPVKLAHSAPAPRPSRPSSLAPPRPAAARAAQDAQRRPSTFAAATQASLQRERETSAHREELNRSAEPLRQKRAEEVHNFDGKGRSLAQVVDSWETTLREPETSSVSGAPLLPPPAPYSAPRPALERPAEAPQSELANLSLASSAIPRASLPPLRPHPTDLVIANATALSSGRVGYVESQVPKSGAAPSYLRSVSSKIGGLVAEARQAAIKRRKDLLSRKIAAKTSLDSTNSWAPQLVLQKQAESTNEGPAETHVRLTPVVKTTTDGLPSLSWSIPVSPGVREPGASVVYDMDLPNSLRLPASSDQEKRELRLKRAKEARNTSVLDSHPASINVSSYSLQPSELSQHQQPTIPTLTDRSRPLIDQHLQEHQLSSNTDLNSPEFDVEAAAAFFYAEQDNSDEGLDDPELAKALSVTVNAIRRGSIGA